MEREERRKARFVGRQLVEAACWLKKRFGFEAQEALDSSESKQKIFNKLRYRNMGGSVV